MKEIIKTIKGSKRLLYISLLLLIVGFSVVLNYTFSAFTQSTVKNAADITVSELVYNTSVNGNNTNIMAGPAGETTKSNVVIVSQNAYNTKYEITYQVCSDSACNTIISKPNNFEVYYSSITPDPVNGTVQSAGSKTIKIVIVNDTNTTYYIKIGINAGYAHNALTLTDQINEPYIENDLDIRTTINGVRSNDFPSTAAYDASVSCVQLDGEAISTTASILWNGTKWVLEVYNLTKYRTQCNVSFTTGTGPTAWYESEPGDLLYGMKLNNNSPQDTWTIPGVQYSQSKDGSSIYISNNNVTHYCTAGTGYGQDPLTGKFYLTGVSVIRQYDSSFIGKYFPTENYVGSCSTTNEQLNTTDLTVVAVGSYSSSIRNRENEVLKRWIGVDTTLQDYYWTYGTGITNNNGQSGYAMRFDLDGVGTLKYSDDYQNLIGKYIVSLTAANNASATNAPVSGITGIEKIYEVLDAKPNYLIVVKATEKAFAKATDDYGTSFYYRGNIQNNYVLFANMCWRIVRIVGDGSIKMVLYDYNPNNASNPCAYGVAQNNYMYLPSTGTSTPERKKYNNSTNANAYIGYMYGTPNSSSYIAEHTNTNNSNLLNVLMEWYDDKLRSYNNKLADVSWCNDKTIASDLTYNPSNYTGDINLGYGTSATYYALNERFASGSNIPNINCPTTNSNLSRFSTTAAKGNGKLTTNGLEYKIGVLSADEAMLAGLTTMYITTGSYLGDNAFPTTTVGYRESWSLTPTYFDGSTAQIYTISSGHLSFRSVSYSNAYVRPAIALKSDTTISSGTGTQSDPYVIN